MKILVIGSKGFIGSHLCNYLSGKGKHIVWGADVATDYSAENYLQIDASNSDFDELFASHSFDICINCSGSARVPDSLLNPTRDYYLNTFNVFKLLDAIRKNGSHCKFLNLSSAAVYGNPEKLPIKETYLVKPLSPYGWHKYQGELLCREYFEIFGIRTCSVRIFSAYGIGLRKQIFWEWYQKTKLKEQVCLLGKGNESRDFIYIDDLIQAINCVIRNGAFEADVVNIGNGEEIYIRDAAKIFCRHMKGGFSYFFSNKPREGDPLNWKADINKLLDLGYKQQVDFEEGIGRYIEWLEGAK